MDIDHIKDLKPDPANARKHNPRNIGQIVSALHEVGAARSIVIDEDNYILAGNGVTEAAAIAGIENVKVVEVDGNTIVAVRRTGLTPEQKKRLALFDNRTAELAEWDIDQLKIEFDAGMLDGLFGDVELAAFGFEEDKPEAAEPQIDKAEELREKWGVESGQLWQLGEHRLICGDCTDKDVVDRVMGGERAALLFTSPPYADAREYGGDDLEIDNLTKFIPVYATFVDLFAINLGIIRRDNEVVRYWDSYIAEAELSGLKLLSWNVWDREQPWSMAQNTAMFPLEHEWVFVFGMKRKQLNLTVENKTPGTRTGITNRQKDGTLERAQPKEVRSHRPLGTIFTSPPHIGSDIGHPAMFPVVFPEAYIEACTIEDDVIAEPFLGSGTTMIAADRLNRRCFGIEISPAYCAVSIQRWVDTTGGDPVLVIEE